MSKLVNQSGTVFFQLEEMFLAGPAQITQIFDKTNPILKVSFLLI